MGFLSHSVFRSSRLEVIWKEFPRTSVRRLFIIRSLRTSPVLWILGWALLKSCAGILFILFRIQIRAQPLVEIGGVRTDISSICLAAALITVVIMIQLSGRAMLRYTTLFAILSMAFFFLRIIEFLGLHAHESKLIEAGGKLRGASTVLGNVLIDSLLVYLVPRGELGCIFGITNSIIGLLAGDGPTK